MSLRVRIVAVLLALASLASVALAADGAGDGTPTYSLQLDNAFGLTEGSEVRVAGVEAGTVREIRLDEHRMLAELELELTADGFGDLRRDVRCQARPQSLIGEYFLDCDPGTSEERLPDGGTIPVEQTSSVVPPDLIQNVMRRPYRERFAIILSELGIGLTARGRDLNETIRRANPALRQVNRVLAILAEQRRTIRDLYQHADAVLADVARRRRDVARFVTEARDTTRVYAQRAPEVDRQLELLPTFLDELRPTLGALEGTAQAQEPALRALRASATSLAATLRTSGAFARAAPPAVRALAELGRDGRRSLRRSVPNLRRLARAVRPLPETAGNLGIVLDHVNDPRFAVERDPRSPRGGSGFTGLESLLRFVHGQSQATNVFDDDSYMIKILQIFDERCGPYADARRARRLPDRCHAWLGPNQPGVTTPDPTATEGGSRRPRATQATAVPVGGSATPDPSDPSAVLLDFLFAP